MTLTQRIARFGTAVALLAAPLALASPAAADGWHHHREWHRHWHHHWHHHEHGYR